MIIYGGWERMRMPNRTEVVAGIRWWIVAIVFLTVTQAMIVVLQHVSEMKAIHARPAAELASPDETLRAIGIVLVRIALHLATMALVIWGVMRTMFSSRSMLHRVVLSIVLGALLLLSWWINVNLGYMLERGFGMPRVGWPKQTRAL